jgi:hypothetical protein
VRSLLALAGGAAGAYIFFKFFEIAYIDWAVWRYPRNNSMAGLAAFMFGVPLAGSCGIVVFCTVFFWGKKGE